MSFGRVNGMYSWRVGWRADVLRNRTGDATFPPLESLVDPEARVRIAALAGIGASSVARDDEILKTCVQPQKRRKHMQP